MKSRILFMSVFALFCSVVYAQKPVKDHYTVSGGLLGDANFYKFMVQDVNNVGYNYKLGWDAGIWVNIPLGELVSIEPQFTYSSRGYDPQNPGIVFPAGTMNIFSIPLLLKFHVGNIFAFGVGPQFDFLTSVKDFNNNLGKGDFRNTSYAVTGGFEFLPHSRITLFGRYIYGLNDMYTYDDKDATIITKPYYRNSGIVAGLKLKLFGHHVAAVIPPPPPPPVVIDTDGDGIPDNVDKCPTVPGIAKYNGCPIPDTDGDGINDEQDKCPSVPGVAKYQGCPIPDTDGDGINDEEDKCPTVPGVAKYQGCPIPDTDGDGVNDEEDKCPNRVGVASNLGCPEITFYYKRAIAQLSASDKKSLDSVVRFMNNNPTLNVIVEGYTSITGTEKFNQKLSEQRSANTVKYLVSKGIDKSRLSAVGFGETSPTGDDQKTEAGRAKNRRTIMRINKN